MVTLQGPVASRHGLALCGLKQAERVHWNLGVPALYEAALQRREGHVAEGGAFVALTGTYTGRSPKDKFIVDDATTHDNVWWGPTNQAMSSEAFARMHAKVVAYLQARDLFVQDLHAGADPENRHAALGDFVHQHAIGRFANGVKQSNAVMEHEAITTRIEVSTPVARIQAE